MTAGKYVIRPMTRVELDTAIEWAAAEGWNPGWHDADAFFAADPTGYYLGLLDDEPIGSISVVKYGGYSFLGFFIVKPEHRGRKYGLRLWLHAVESSGVTPTGLDGVLAQTGNYARSGFENAYRNQRFAGISAGPNVTDERIVPYTPSDFDAVLRYDTACFPTPRPAFLEHWLAQPEAHVRVLREDGAVRGYGMLRRARDGYRVGPLFADGSEHADALFDALAGSVPAGTPVFMDVPQANPAAVDLVGQRGMTPVFETARMYRGGFPAFDLDKVFGVTTLELG